MALSGRLEDLNFLEILQIIAFSKKTGTLKVESTLASGAVLFQDGVVLCAFWTSTTPIVSPLSGLTLNESRALVLQDEIRIALRELVALREGQFEFTLTSEPPTHFEGMDISRFLVAGGVDPQSLMLELARELDTARKDSTSLFESSEEMAKHIESELNAASTPQLIERPDITVLLVDDEPKVLDIVGAELKRSGCRVIAAGSAAEALEQLENFVDSETAAVLVTDVAMPSSGGDSFEGGFEVVEKLKKLTGGRGLAMLITESLSLEARARTRKLGVRKVAFKPALTKLDDDEYVADLASFTKILVHELEKLVAHADSSAAEPSVPELNDNLMFDFLKTMTEQLKNPNQNIARMALRVSAKHCERTVLFTVKGPRAYAFAAFRKGTSTKNATEAVKGLAFELQDVHPFAEVVYSRSGASGSHDANALPSGFDRGRAKVYELLPILNNNEVVLVVLCDNPNSGGPIGNLAGLALFLTQAGMAMENAALHKKLRSVEDRYSLEDQGPLTQKHNRIVRDRQS